MITCGIDIGARSIDIVLCGDDGIVASSVAETGISPRENARAAFLALLAESGVPPDGIARTIATGYGRNFFEGMDRAASEILCHAAGTARLGGTTDHAYLDDDSDETSLPERHLELVMLYVRWAAFQELAMGASADPDPTSLALGTLELNAYRAQRLYLTALAECLKAESESRVVNWRIDRWDRVY